jgi:hypothetical protein
MVKVDGKETRDKVDGKEKDGKRGARADGRPRHEHWKAEPDDHDYPAASDYLTLLAGESDAAAIVAALRTAPIVHRKAKDLLRASRLPLLDTTNAHVADDLKKVRRGERLSPVLLVRGALVADVALTVADGYHRICASYHLDENADIPCRMTDPPSRAEDRARTRVRARQPVTGDAPVDDRGA